MIKQQTKELAESRGLLARIAAAVESQGAMPPGDNSGTGRRVSEFGD
jgi:hypothetical protein